MKIRTVKMTSDDGRRALFQAWGDVFIARTDERGPTVIRRLCRSFEVAYQAVDIAIGGHTIAGYRIASETMEG